MGGWSGLMTCSDMANPCLQNGSGILRKRKKELFGIFLVRVVLTMTFLSVIGR